MSSRGQITIPFTSDTAVEARGGQFTPLPGIVPGLRAQPFENAGCRNHDRLGFAPGSADQVPFIHSGGIDRA